MKKLFTIILAVALMLTGCAQRAQEDGRQFTVRLTLDADTAVSEFCPEYFIGPELQGWGGVNRTDGTCWQKGEQVTFVYTEQDFRDPDNLNDFTFALLFGGEASDYRRCANALRWNAEYGEEYAVRLVEDGLGGYRLEGDFPCASISSLLEGGNNTIGMDVFRQLMAENTGNLVFSPLSLEMALAMLFEGAGGNTQEQFDQLYCGNRVLTTPRASLANSLWIDDQLTVRDSYVSLLKDGYEAEVFNCDLALDTYKKINGWVEEKTKDMIRNLFQQPLSSDCVLALINTLYFKACWLETMKESGPRPFNRADGSRVDAQFLTAAGTYDCILTDEYEGVIIPYDDSETYFLAVKGTDLSRLSSHDILSQLLQQAHSMQVRINLPRFEIETAAELNEKLIAIGLTDVFDPVKADLSGIADITEENLFVSKVLQKSRIIVDSQGTEAASATAIVVEKNVSAAPQQIREITFDEPFVFAVINNGCLLFVGRVVDPSGK